MVLRNVEFSHTVLHDQPVLPLKNPKVPPIPLKAVAAPPTRVQGAPPPGAKIAAKPSPSPQAKPSPQAPGRRISRDDGVAKILKKPGEASPHKG